MVFEPVRILTPGIPFRRKVNLFHGCLCVINGSTPPRPEKFAINFHANGQVALHIDTRFSERVVVRNTLTNGKWETEERNGRFPLVPGNTFFLFILVEDDCFRIAYNGEHFATYNHRIPLDKIDKIEVTGDVSFSFFELLHPPMDLLTPSEKQPVIEKIEMDITKKDKLFVLPDGIGNESIIHICGIPGEHRFDLDFYSDDNSKDIGLHISCRMTENDVVLNSREKMRWHSELRPSNFKLDAGQHFDLEVSAEKDVHLLLNSSKLVIFPVRHISADKLKILKIEGSVKLVNISIVKKSLFYA